MSIADAMTTLTAQSQQATRSLEHFARRLHDLAPHDHHHRDLEPKLRWCFADDPIRRCTHDDCCAAATQEDFLCDACRSGTCRPVDLTDAIGLPPA